MGETARGLALQHLVREPLQPDGGKPPLLLLLHGVGSNEMDLFSLAPKLPPPFQVVSARAPYPMGSGSFAWFHVQFTPRGPVHVEQEAESSRQLLLHFLDQLAEAYGTDPEAVFLMGFSQGAIMTVSLVLTAPHRLRGGVAMSGRALPEMVARAAPPGQLEGFPIMVTHGLYDQVLPIEYGRGIRDVFAPLPVELDYREYPMAHEVSSRAFDDVRGWLSERVAPQPRAD